VSELDEKAYSLWERVFEKYGFPTALVVVGLLFVSGSIASPITENRDMLKEHVVATNELIVEVRKLVRLMSVMCVKQASPAECIVALTPAPASGVK
jgi:hypothetical protein